MTIERRIAEILRDHQRRIDFNHPAYGQCQCGFNPEEDEELYPHEMQANHVAEVLVSKLGLKCCCGEITTLRVVHRVNKPCYRPLEEVQVDTSKDIELPWA